MPRRVSSRVLLILTLLAINGLAARGNTEDDDDHHAEEEHDEEVINSCPIQDDLITQFNSLAADLDIVSPGTNDTLCQIVSPPEVDHVNITTVDIGGYSVLSCESVYQVCQQLILAVNLTTEECLEGHTDNNTEDGGVTAAQAYGFGFLMVMFVSLGSLIGVVLVPLIHTKSRMARLMYEYTYAFMISLGASALLSDAILHLIPHAFGLHAHDESGEGGHGEDEHESESTEYIWKGCLVLGGIYFFFLMEIALHFLGKYIKSRVKNVKANGEHEDHTHYHCHSGDMHYTPEIPADNKPQAEKSEEIAKPLKNTDNEEDDVKIVQPKFCDLSCHRIKPVAWLIILGDSLHNFADGLALGAAIAESLALGLGTMFALLFHEVPHELGDYAILLKSGIHWCTALILNFLSSLTAVIGFFIGVAISAHSAEANEWILSFAAGLFIYIALVDLLPEIVHGEEHSHDGDDHHHKEPKLTDRGHHWWIRFGLINLGFFVSFAFLLVIAVYEEDLAEAF